jgi:ORMDL family
MDKSPIRQPPPARPRMNSKDIPRTYSGLYGEGNDLLPFELARNRNTDWVSTAGWQLLGTYTCVLFMVHLTVLGLVDFSKSWTVTATLHALVTMVYLHWIKGSPNFYEQGEMNAMTFWEQLDSTEGTSNARTALLIIPTLLCYAACHFANYNIKWSVLNVCVWLICIVGKLPFMNGVRIMGINRTTGIDDYDRGSVGVSHKGKNL